MNENHFETGGAGYAASRPSYPPALAEALVQTCPRRDHALDVGCGNGQLSGLLAAHFDHVTATDPSADQLAHATPHPRISYRAEAAEKIGLPDASIDLITAAQAAHWFDLPAFYAEARRVARPGARLALISYGVPRLEGAPGRAFNAFYWGPFHAYWPEGRAHVEEGYSRLAFPFDEGRIDGLAITRAWSLTELIAYMRTWSASRRAEAVGQVLLLDSFAQEMAQIWGAEDQRRQITWPVTCRLGLM